MSMVLPPSVQIADPLRADRQRDCFKGHQRQLPRRPIARDMTPATFRPYEPTRFVACASYPRRRSTLAMIQRPGRAGGWCVTGHAAIALTSLYPWGL